MFLLGEGAISWKSAKEFVIVSSNIEVEFMAGFKIIIHTLWLWIFILELEIVDTIIKLLEIYCDNFVMLFFSKNDKYSKDAKHMELKYFAVKEEEIQK